MEKYYDIRIPDTGSEFEQLTRNVCETIFHSPFEFYGRNGQEQNGIDLFSKNFKICVQCKNYQGDHAENRLRAAFQKDFCAAVEKFGQKMKKYVLATTARRDTQTQDLADMLSSQHSVEIQIIFWEDYQAILREHPEILNHLADTIPDSTDTEKSIDEFFDEVFGKNNQEATQPALSPMAFKLKKKRERTITTRYVSWLELWDEAEKKINPSSSENQLRYRHSLVDRGKHFTEPVDKNIVTVLYEIYKSWSYATKTKYYFVEKTDSIDTLMPDGQKYVTYYIDNPQPNGNQICLLHFDKSKEYVLINCGMLIDDKFIVSKKPLVLEFHPQKTKPRSADSFQFDNLSETEKDEFLNGVFSVGEYSIDVDSTIVMIDTETFQPVPKEIYLENGEYRAKFKMIHDRSYFAFQVRSKDDSDCKLSEFELAECYRFGYGDFPKDEIKAAEIFEQIGDADSMRQLAHIWLNECQNDTESLSEGLSCLEQAVQLGNTTAKAELIYYTLKLLYALPDDGREAVLKDFQRRIQDGIVAKTPESMFLVGYIYEKGLFVEKDIALAFSCYHSAAQEGKLAAKARINLAPVGICNDADACRRSFEQSVKESGFAEYCMGWFLADDPEVIVDGDDILYFYTMAANHGVVAAIEELAELYSNENTFVDPDPTKALMWYEKLPDPDDDTAIRLANRFLDGDGCEKGPENDRNALRLLRNVIAKSENAVAYNNLGWMYKNGRGIPTPDYPKAITCFEKAVDLGNGSSCYHLGGIYEQGLGVEVDLQAAKVLYQKGAERGHKKCQEKISAE